MLTILKRSCIVLFFPLMFNVPCYSNEAVDSAVVKEVIALIQKSDKLLYYKTDSAKMLAEQAMDIARKEAYDLGMANALNILGVVFDIYGDFAKSFSQYKQAFDIYAHHEDEKGMANCLGNMGLILKQDGKYDEALIYITDSYNYNNKLGRNANMAGNLMTIGNLLLAKGSGLNEVLQKMKEGERIARNISDFRLICSSLNLQGDAYLKFEKFHEAISHYKQAAGLIKDLNMPWNLGYSYQGLSKSYLKSGQLALALESSQKGIDEYRSINHKFGIMELYQIRVEINEKLNDFKSSLRNFRIHKAYSDSLYNEKQSKQINLLKVQFETEKKEAELSSLSQQASIQALEIRQKNQVILIGLIGILFALTLVYFMYKQRTVNRERIQTEIEQRFLRSQLNPHFISNALLAVQNFMLQNEAQKAALYLAKFSKLMREILEHSRQEFIPVENEIQMLTNYLDIHKLRMQKTFDYAVEVDDKINAEMDTIPPMFIQPFVENAIEHGIINAGGKGLIELKFRKEGRYISIEIKDNGGGLTQNSEKSKEHTSLSTTIIRERIALFNKTLKNKIQLLFEDIANDQGQVSGTKVELKVPFDYV